MSAVVVSDRPGFLQDLDTIAVLWRRDLLRFLRQPSRIVGALGQPILFWLLLGSGMGAAFTIPGAPGLGYPEYFFPGVVLMIVVFASIFSTVSVIEDRQRGFLQTVLVSPGSRAAMVIGKSLGSTSVALLQAGLFIALAPWAGFAPGRISWGLLLLVLTVTSLSLTAFGFALAWWLDNLQAYHAIQMSLLVPLWAVSGAMFPSPGGAFGTAMRLDPLSYAVEAVRRALYGGLLPAGLVPHAALATDLLVLLAFLALSFGLAVFVVHRRR